MSARITTEDIRRFYKAPRNGNLTACTTDELLAYIEDLEIAVQTKTLRIERHVNRLTQIKDLATRPIEMQDEREPEQEIRDIQAQLAGILPAEWTAEEQKRFIGQVKNIVHAFLAQIERLQA